MSLPIQLDPEARDEFDEAYRFYENRRAGGGDDFAAGVRAVLSGIAASPKMHQTVYGDVRRAVVRGYPYCVYYREDAGVVRVVSVFHTSRDPAIWQGRV